MQRELRYILVVPSNWLYDLQQRQIKVAEFWTPQQKLSAVETERGEIGKLNG